MWCEECHTSQIRSFRPPDRGFLVMLGYYFSANILFDMSDVEWGIFGGSLLNFYVTGSGKA